ncbi:DEAD/DEAH box helicase [Sphingomicrobium sp. GRR-S6-50]|uniref:DEAD/DEAH box helicase n=1 Tax=Sphingomicrobium sediminis TaxID=2950949 RepID=A0A9X2ENA8_9SPHN|nr:DEAD/DEAH box helicase [Sphingomicrobium sediminis]MCM8558332.1 DEAD/DEAH box helicase [Sphingomicrobium sediminis]
MSFFRKLGLSKPILNALDTQGYTEPTPIQREAIPALMEGRDLMGIAQTGTGKTAAFALPSIHNLTKDGFTPRQPASCRMLVLSPTRELAAQIATSFKGYSKGTGLRVNVVFGGKPIHAQARGLVGGTDVLVATPGRLLDLIDRRALTLKGVEIFVLDEADQMMDLGFIKPLQQIARMLPEERQSLFFSATMPKAIADLGKQFIKNPVKVEVTPQSTTAERIDQGVTFLNQREKQALLTMRINEGLRDGSIDRALVFTRTKHGADRVVRFLLGAGIEAAAIHGNKSQGQRTAALNAFRSGDCPILVATDIAARGIDVPGVSHVFNFELPNVPEQYVHRIGRTARAGAEGAAISFCAPDEKSYLRQIEKLTGVKITPMPLPANFIERADALPKAAPKSAGKGRWTPMDEEHGDGVNSRPPQQRRPKKSAHRIKPRFERRDRDEQPSEGQAERKPFRKKHGGGGKPFRAAGEGRPQRQERGEGRPQRFDREGGERRQGGKPFRNGGEGRPQRGEQQRAEGERQEGRRHDGGKPFHGKRHGGPKGGKPHRGQGGGQRHGGQHQGGQRQGGAPRGKGGNRPAQRRDAR